MWICSAILNSSGLFLLVFACCCYSIPPPASFFFGPFLSCVLALRLALLLSILPYEIHPLLFQRAFRKPSFQTRRSQDIPHSRHQGHWTVRCASFFRLFACSVPKSFVVFLRHSFDLFLCRIFVSHAGCAKVRVVEIWRFRELSAGYSGRCRCSYTRTGAALDEGLQVTFRGS